MCERETTGASSMSRLIHMTTSGLGEDVVNLRFGVFCFGGRGDIGDVKRR